MAQKNSPQKVSQRAHRLADQMQRELMDLLRFDIKDPRIGNITVTAVEVTSDMSHATIFFTHLSGVAESQNALFGLQKATGHLRSELSHRLSTYSVPQLHFKYDQSIEEGMRLSSLIDAAVAADKKLST